MGDDSFAALMKQAHQRGSATGRRLRVGEIVRVKVMQAAGDTVFVDAGTPGDGRIPRGELSDENGELLVKPGELVDAAVVDASPDGPRFSVSRRALVEERRRASLGEVLARLTPGTDVEGTIRGINKHGAIVDLDGVDGFIHISELARHRVERVEDVVQQGERLTVRVLSIEESERGPRVRLSRKALEAAPVVVQGAPDEVLHAKVVGASNGGLTILTSKGEGYLPISELGLPPGADHRRAYPAGKELDVVLVSGAGARPRFSAVQVARVQERKNYRDYAQAAGPAAPTAVGFGQLGDLLRERLGLPPAPPEPAAAAVPAAAPATVAAPSPPAVPAARSAGPTPAAAAAAPVRPVTPTAPSARPAPKPNQFPAGRPAPQPSAARPEQHEGVIRRRRPDSH
jgi:ribosomal protein S1